MVKIELIKTALIKIETVSEVMLIDAVNVGFDKRIQQYANDEKLWSFSTSTIPVASGKM